MAESLNVKTIRERLGWNQERMAAHLGLHRTRVSRMENGQEPTGPVIKLLEQLQAQLDAKLENPQSSGTEAA